MNEAPVIAAGRIKENGLRRFVVVSLPLQAMKIQIDSSY